MGNRGADLPTGTPAPICLHQSMQASMTSIRTSDSRPIGALSVCSAPNSAENLIDVIYIPSSVTLHVLVTLIRRGDASLKRCSALGVSKKRWCPLQSATKLKISYRQSRTRSFDRSSGQSANFDDDNRSQSGSRSRTHAISCRGSASKSSALEF